MSEAFSSMETDNLVRMRTAMVEGAGDVRYMTVGRPPAPVHSAAAASDRDVATTTPDDPFQNPPVVDKSQGERSNVSGMLYCFF